MVFICTHNLIQTNMNGISLKYFEVLYFKCWGMMLPHNLNIELRNVVVINQVAGKESCLLAFPFILIVANLA